jgi:hypothetical protein
MTFFPPSVSIQGVIVRLSGGGQKNENYAAQFRVRTKLWTQKVGAKREENARAKRIDNRTNRGCGNASPRWRPFSQSPQETDPRDGTLLKQSAESPLGAGWSQIGWVESCTRGSNLIQ